MMAVRDRAPEVKDDVGLSGELLARLLSATWYMGCVCVGAALSEAVLHERWAQERARGAQMQARLASAEQMIASMSMEIAAARALANSVAAMNAVQRVLLPASTLALLE
jgi:hypothetical protein